MEIVISESNLIPFLSNWCICPENKLLNGTGTCSSPQSFSVHISANIWPESHTQLNTSTPGVQFLIRSGLIKRLKCSFSYTAHLPWLSQYYCVVAIIIGILCGFTIYEGQTEVTNKNLPNWVLVITLYFIATYLSSVTSLLLCHISVKVSPHFPFKMHSAMWRHFYSTSKNSLFID